MEKNQLCCNYDFDREKEKRIYRYVYKKCKKREKNKLRDDYKFNTYSEWKEYVWLKYNSYDRTKLIDFLHLLKFMKRNIKPVEKLGDMVFAASYAFVIVEFFNIFLKAQQDIENIKKVLIALILTVIIIVIIGGAFFFITNVIMRSISSNNMDSSMYEDYISIIQEIIQSKENEEK